MAEDFGVNDTSPEARIAFRKIITSKTEEERILMCAEMYETAREFIISSMPENLPVNDQKRYIYEKIYGEPLPEDFFERFPS